MSDPTPTSRTQLEANAAARRDLLAPTRDILARLTARLDELDNPEAVLLALASTATTEVVRRRMQRMAATTGSSEPERAEVRAEVTKAVLGEVSSLVWSDKL